jgi:hypothetical protein
VPGRPPPHGGTRPSGYGAGRAPLR